MKCCEFRRVRNQKAAVVEGEVNAALEHDVLPDEHRPSKHPVRLHVFAQAVQR